MPRIQAARSKSHSRMGWIVRALQAVTAGSGICVLLLDSQVATSILAILLAGATIALLEILHRQTRAAQRVGRDLRNIENRFERAFRLGPAPMAISRLSDGTFVDMNDMYLDYYGYTRQEMLGRTSRELQIISDTERANLVRNLRLNSFVQNVFLRTRTKNGTPREVLFSSETIDFGGEPHMLSILFDITERQAALETLRQRETELAEAQRIAKLGGWTLDLNTNAARWSEAFAVIHDRAPEWDGAHMTSYLELIVPEDRTAVVESIRHVAETGRPSTFDYRVMVSEGDIRWMTVRMDVITDESGRPAKIRGITQDITDRMKLEAQLRQSQKLDAIGQLAGGIAHDLNNILGIIVGYIAMAEEDLPRNHAVQEWLAGISKASRRGADLVRRIMSVSSPRTPDGGVVFPDAVLDEAVQLLRASLPAMVAIRTQIEENIPPIRGDATQIQQILIDRKSVV